MKKKNIIWKLLFIVGLIPFIIILVKGVYSAINGLSCIDDCIPTYGIKAFIDTIKLYSLFLWPTYIVGIVLIIVSAVVLLKNK